MKCTRCGLESAAPPCPRCLLQAPIDETRFGEHFVIADEIGHGGMGTVFRAHDVRIDRPCALKLIDGAALADEGRMLARLSHPGIVALYEAGTIDSQAYVAMELVEGAPLTMPLPVRECVRIGIALADALGYAHAAGVCHHDIKPANVLMTRDGQPKLADFGIARAVHAPQPRAVALTPGYAAPEVMRGEAGPRSDVFSLGVLLFQCCTGELPAGDMKPLPWPLDGVLRRALAQDSERRFADAREMKTALEGVARAIDAAELPHDEQNWVRAVALLFTAASGIALWALLQSISPVILEGDNVYPLARMALRRLNDGRLVSLARLEIAPTLTALALFAAAFFALGLLRRHWRLSGLEEARPDRALPQARTVMAIAIGAVAVFVARRLAMAAGADLVVLYVPVLGGLLELAILYWAWLAVIEAARTQRALHKEWMLWGGFWLALLPPALELLTYIRALALH